MVARRAAANLSIRRREMEQAVKRALSATEQADKRIMAMRAVERRTRELVKAVLDMRRVCQSEEAVRDRVYERALREDAE
jgi:hypothetical protein